MLKTPFIQQQVVKIYESMYIQKVTDTKTIYIKSRIIFRSFQTKVFKRDIRRN